MNDKNSYTSKINQPLAPDSLLAERTLVYCEPSFLIREALSSLFENLLNFKILAVTGEFEETINAVVQTKPSLLVTEVDLPGKSGIEMLHELRRSAQPVSSLILTKKDCPKICRNALIAGASGYILKSDKANDLKECVEAILCGKPYISEKFREIQKDLNGPILNGAEKLDLNQDPLERLSPREREIFHLLTNGLTNIRIAKKLFISPRTVETHRAKIVQKLEVSNNAELIHYAIKNGLSVF